MVGAARLPPRKYVHEPPGLGANNEQAPVLLAFAQLCWPPLPLLSFLSLFADHLVIGIEN
jgi:hypothetical protein